MYGHTIIVHARVCMHAYIPIGIFSHEISVNTNKTAQSTTRLIRSATTRQADRVCQFYGFLFFFNVLYIYIIFHPKIWFNNVKHLLYGLNKEEKI